MKLITGLGNPERVYASTRHNIGFMCISHFARSQGIRFDSKLGRARVAVGEVAGNEVVLARPQTHMNSSGDSVSRLVRRFNIDLADLIVIHDDLDLPLDKIRIRRGGSSGGHKGINSIIAALGSPDFIRIRIGIGRPPGDLSESKEPDIIAYVLSDFTAEERAIIALTIPRVSEAILCLITEGLAAAMNKYN